MARDRRRSGFPDRDRDRTRRQTLRRPRRPASRRQPGLARGRCRAPADRPRRRGLLTLHRIRKCSAKPPARRGLSLPLGYLANRTVEDGLDIGSRKTGSKPGLGEAAVARKPKKTLPKPRRQVG